MQDDWAGVIEGRRRDALEFGAEGIPEKGKLQSDEVEEEEDGDDHPREGE